MKNLHSHAQYMRELQFQKIEQKMLAEKKVENFQFSWIFFFAENLKANQILC